MGSEAQGHDFIRPLCFPEVQKQILKSLDSASCKRYTFCKCGDKLVGMHIAQNTGQNLGQKKQGAIFFSEKELKYRKRTKIHKSIKNRRLFHQF